jgi:hypothetical protein
MPNHLIKLGSLAILANNFLCEKIAAVTSHHTNPGVYKQIPLAKARVIQDKVLLSDLLNIWNIYMSSKGANNIICGVACRPGME